MALRFSSARPQADPSFIPASSEAQDWMAGWSWWGRGGKMSKFGKEWEDEQVGGGAEGGLNWDLDLLWLFVVLYEVVP